MKTKSKNGSLSTEQWRQRVARLVGVVLPPSATDEDILSELEAKAKVMGRRHRALWETNRRLFEKNKAAKTAIRALVELADPQPR